MSMKLLIGLLVLGVMLLVAGLILMSFHLV